MGGEVVNHRWCRSRSQSGGRAVSAEQALPEADLALALAAVQGRKHPAVRACLVAGRAASGSCPGRSPGGRAVSAGHALPKAELAKVQS